MTRRDMLSSPGQRFVNPERQRMIERGGNPRDLRSSRDDSDGRNSRGGGRGYRGGDRDGRDGYQGGSGYGDRDGRDGGYGGRGGYNGGGGGGQGYRGGGDNSAYLAARNAEREASTVTIWPTSPQVAPLDDPAPPASSKHKHKRRRSATPESDASTRSSRSSRSRSRSVSVSASASDSSSSDADRRLKRRGSSKSSKKTKKSSRHKKSSRRKSSGGSSSKKSRRVSSSKKSRKSKGSKRRSRRRSDSDSDSDSGSGSDSDASSGHGSDAGKSASVASATAKNGGDPELTDAARATIEDYWREKEVKHTDDAPVGPMPLPVVEKHLTEHDYGGALLAGEGSAMAAYLQSGKRIPRRGEIGLTSDEIENFEGAGFVMSGNRHKRMTAVRIRKENQVISAEERQALLMFAQEANLKKEAEIIGSFKELVSGFLVPSRMLGTGWLFLAGWLFLGTRWLTRRWP
ncbi:ras-induced vulval development antagonist-domain-containing protein [Entophlyctis helioformis]|nr:ras-induced vulval development antagonist-domain-containing protein [Entophlyctis helioformis]